jgi:hypothetical protein
MSGSVGGRRDGADPVAAWLEVSARIARTTGVRTPAAAGTRPGAAAFPIGALALAVVVVVGILATRPSAVGPASSGDPGGSREPVSAATDDGMFRLELATPRSTYGPGEAIEPVARVTYLGPDGAVSVGHSLHEMVFRIEEVDGARAMEGGDRLSCGSTNLVRDQALVVPFRKSGSPDDPAKGFDLAWYQDPVLDLPIGTWRITAQIDFRLGGCDGTADHRLEVSNVITVAAPAGDGPVIDRADDGAFRLELVTPRRTYAPGDPIGTTATVTYLGPLEETAIARGGSIVGFAIDEVGGDRRMDGGMTAQCSPASMRRDEPLTIPFEKAGSIGEAGFDRAWYDDPLLRLPAGTWRIRAYLAISTSDGTTVCGGRGHPVEVQNVITVAGPEAPTASPAPMTSPSRPEPSPDPSPQPSAGPIATATDDGTFRLELSIPRALYGPDDAIEPAATVTYLGPASSVTYGHSSPAAFFTIAQVGGAGAQMTGAAADLCELSSLGLRKPETIAFAKSGQAGLGFDVAWFDDPVLRLPPGTWRIAVRFEASVPGCDVGAARHEAVAEAVITVR